ncbi:hypothetical protein AGMMS50256_09030 [Betaproteobacteria bacterium]|nr:hypothetical protein AGMMS50256_09030 [Betaproteobacteria bacterium]
MPGIRYQNRAVGFEVIRNQNQTASFDLIFTGKKESGMKITKLEEKVQSPAEITGLFFPSNREEQP